MPNYVINLLILKQRRLYIMSWSQYHYVIFLKSQKFMIGICHKNPNPNPNAFVPLALQNIHDLGYQMPNCVNIPFSCPGGIHLQDLMHTTPLGTLEILSVVFGASLTELCDSLPPEHPDPLEWLSNTS